MYALKKVKTPRKLKDWAIFVGLLKCVNLWIILPGVHKYIGICDIDNEIKIKLQRDNFHSNVDGSRVDKAVGFNTILFPYLFSKRDLFSYLSTFNH